MVPLDLTHGHVCVCVCQNAGKPKLVGFLSSSCNKKGALKQHSTIQTANNLLLLSKSQGLTSGHPFRGVVHLHFLPILELGLGMSRRSDASAWIAGDKILHLGWKNPAFCEITGLSSFSCRRKKYVVRI